MKEVTRIITAEVTKISNFEDCTVDFLVENKEECEQSIASRLKEDMNADDVHVKVQYFVRDLADG